MRALRAAAVWLCAAALGVGLVVPCQGQDGQPTPAEARPGAPPMSNATMQALYMRRCIELAKQSVANGSAPYGALIVDPTTHTILVEGANHAGGNPIWHGEMDAITRLAEKIAPTPVTEVAPGLELYTSAEPCSMCISAIAWANFARVFYGTDVPYLIAHGQPQINVRAANVANASTFDHVAVFGGVLHNETDALYNNQTKGAGGHPRSSP